MEAFVAPAARDRRFSWQNDRGAVCVIAVIGAVVLMVLWIEAAADACLQITAAGQHTGLQRLRRLKIALECAPSAEQWCVLQAMGVSETVLLERWLKNVLDTCRACIEHVLNIL